MSSGEPSKVAFPERSVLWQCPEELRVEVYAAALSGGPTLEEKYGIAPSDYIASAIRHGPSGVSTSAMTTVTNKAVISALLLTFNYTAISTATDQPEVSHLYRNYFFCQMTSVVLAFCVMLSAASFTSHVGRCGQRTCSVMAYLQSACWINTYVNAPLFVLQCFFNVAALVLDVALTYSDSFMMLIFIAMAVLSAVMLSIVHIRSHAVMRRVAHNEWVELLQAEHEFRTWAATRRLVLDKGAGPGPGGAPDGYGSAAASAQTGVCGSIAASAYLEEASPRGSDVGQHDGDTVPLGCNPRGGRGGGSDRGSGVQTNAFSGREGHMQMSLLADAGPDNGTGLGASAGDGGCRTGARGGSNAGGCGCAAGSGVRCRVMPCGAGSGAGGDPLITRVVVGS